MRWIQVKRVVRSTKARLQWEEWVTDVDQPCPRCKALDGKRYVKGRGPQPVKDTHPGCRCRRVPITGRFGDSPVQRTQGIPSLVAARVVRRQLRQASFIMRSCKDCD